MDGGGSPAAAPPAAPPAAQRTLVNGGDIALGPAGEEGACGAPAVLGGLRGGPRSRDRPGGGGGERGHGAGERSGPQGERPPGRAGPRRFGVWGSGIPLSGGSAALGAPSSPPRGGGPGAHLARNSPP